MHCLFGSSGRVEPVSWPRQVGCRDAAGQHGVAVRLVTIVVALAGRSVRLAGRRDRLTRAAVVPRAATRLDMAGQRRRVIVMIETAYLSVPEHGRQADHGND